MKSKDWKKEDQSSKKMRFESEENFYNTLSNDEEQLKGKFEKMEVVEEENEKKKNLLHTQERKKNITIRTGRCRTKRNLKSRDNGIRLRTRWLD